MKKEELILTTYRALVLGWEKWGLRGCFSGGGGRISSDGLLVCRPEPKQISFSYV